MSLIMKIYDWLREHDLITDNEPYTYKMRRNVEKNAKWWVLGFGLVGGSLFAIIAWLLLHLGKLI